jgi:hypothetical protein
MIKSQPLPADFDLWLEVAVARVLLALPKITAQVQACDARGAPRAQPGPIGRQALTGTAVRRSS